jgi:CRISPR-associated protein (TIGR03986 family)
MNELLVGKLYLRTTKSGKQLVLDRPAKGGSQPLPVKAQLSTELQGLGEAALDQMEVEYELEKGQVVRVRRKGQPWLAHAAAAPARGGGAGRTNPEMRRRRQDDRRPGAGQAHPEPVVRPRPPAFHNPYNFIPAPPRVTDGPLADAPPVGHHRYHQDHWSGTISVQLTTKTPLLILDAAEGTTSDRDHKTFPTRLTASGEPYLAPPSAKGMLRSAYEAVTNSRMAILGAHDERLAYRMDAGEGLSLVPARISRGMVHLLLGETADIPTESTGGRWEIPRKLMYAAWLRRYRQPHRKEWGELAEHGRSVWAFVTRWQHDRPSFDFWNVVALRDGAAAKPTDEPTDDRTDWEKARPAQMSSGHWVHGHVCITNQNIDRKHDERVFFLGDEHPKAATLSVPLDVEIMRQWRELIRNYQAAHRDQEVWQRRADRGNVIAPEVWKGRDPGDTAWSRHIYEDGKPRHDNRQPQPDTAQLADGTLCYARVDHDGNGYKVRALYPVMIARKLFEADPNELLHESLKPATSLAQLSPADRVFGWVNQDGSGAYRGNLRIGPVHGRAEDVLRFESAVPLAILGQPKPQQVRFYAASDQSGKPLPDGTTKDRGYLRGRGLRGRKTYPHHAGLPRGYWDEPWVDRTQSAQGLWHQEYRRPRDTGGAEQRDDQNRSVISWVREGASFTFDIHVTNLSDTEIGALLWLLRLDEAHYFRLGGGKPLGFGSVRLETTAVSLRDGAAWRAYCQTLIASDEDRTIGRRISSMVEPLFGECIDAFTSAVAQAYGNDRAFGDVPFIRAFMQAAKGFADGLPIHYPRLQAAPHPDGKSFEWFVANDRKGGPKLALSELQKPDPGLPWLGEE